MGPDAAGPRAAVDCGTNSTRLLVVGSDGIVLERVMRVTRLGEGVDATHQLAPAAIARTAAVLDDYHATMTRLGVTRARLVATSAVRDATNGDAFLDAARRATGLEPEVLSGHDEGALSFAGATRAVPAEMAGPGPVMVIDVGGGSTELAVGPLAGAEPSPGATPAAPVSALSLDIGCVRVTERFLGHDPPRPDELERARAAVTEQLDGARPRLPPLDPDGLLIGLAGTVSTLAALEQELPHYDRAALHHARLTRHQVDRWCATLAAEPARDRLARPGMIEGRADVIVGGTLILQSAMAVFERNLCLVSEDDILDGLVLSLG